MHPEILTALTSAKSVAMSDCGASPRELADRKWFTPANGAENGSVRWTPPRGSRAYRPNPWTFAEAAMACKNLNDRYFQAIQFEYASSEASFYPLKLALFEFAISEKRRLQWPNTVKTSDGHRKYLERLCDILLIEIRQPWRFVRASNAPGMWRVLMNVDERTWRVQLSPVYECLRAEHRRWVAVAIAHMRRWLDE